MFHVMSSRIFRRKDYILRMYIRIKSGIFCETNTNSAGNRTRRSFHSLPIPRQRRGQALSPFGVQLK